MIKLRPLALGIVGAALVAGCAAGSKMSVVQSSQLPARPIARLAIAPGSGALGDAIGLELVNRGLTVIDANEASAIVGKAGLEEFEVTTAEGFAALQERGVDAILVAESVDARDGTPESASVRVTYVATGEFIAGITWHNALGGMGASIADRTMRKNLSQAAADIAKELSRRLGSGQ